MSYSRYTVNNVNNWQFTTSINQNRIIQNDQFLIVL